MYIYTYTYGYFCFFFNTKIGFCNTHHLRKITPWSLRLPTLEPTHKSLNLSSNTEYLCALEVI